KDENGAVGGAPGTRKALEREEALGTTTVTLSVTSSRGTSSSCIATVTVVDTTPPQIICPGTINLACDVNLLAPAFFSVTATDNCDSALIVSNSPPSGSGFPIGTTVVTSTARVRPSGQEAIAPTQVTLQRMNRICTCA